MNGAKMINPGPARAVADLAQVEHHGALVLLEYPHRQRQTDERQKQDGNDYVGNHACLCVDVFMCPLPRRQSEA